MSSGTGSMILTGTRGLRSPRNAEASASSSAWSQFPNALSVRTYPAMLTGASVVRSPRSQARTSGADSPSTGRPESNAFTSRARIIRYQVEVLGETPSAALAARNRSTAHILCIGWRGRIRTFDLLIQSQAPYRLATRQCRPGFYPKPGARPAGATGACRPVRLDYTARMARTEPAIRRIASPPRTIVRATDLGGVGVLKEGGLFLLTDPFGDIHPDARGLGLYAGDTRVLSCAVLTVDGSRPVVLRGDTDDAYRGTIQLTNAELRRDPSDKVAADRTLARQSLGITRHRCLGPAFQERLVVTNFTEHPETIVIELALGADQADIFEIRGHQRSRAGQALPIVVGPDRLAFGYVGLDRVLRRTRVAFTPGEVIDATASRIAGGEGTPGSALFLRWRCDLEAGGRTELSWTVWADDQPVPTDGRPVELELGDEPVPVVDPAVGETAYRAWWDSTATIASDNELFDALIRRSVADLRQLLNAGPDPGECYLAAGVPWFATLFGRDAIISAYEAIAFRPQLAIDTLEVLAAHQATRDDPASDAEPGKIIHEVRNGEMASAGELPFGAYYGSVDSTPLWLILLGETYDWTGDAALVERLWPNAMAALDWIDRYGDLDGDGFVEYRRRAPGGLMNQGWKDSADAIRDRYGRPLEPPIALAEVQGYVHDAKRRIARLARRRGDETLAARLEREADELRARFDAAFWVDDLDFLAMGLDRDKRPADAIGSNAGQALWGGIVAPERTKSVVARLTGAGLESGWGVRTYASGQPGFNPLGYHTGTVWPHDNALIAAGLKRAGYDVEAGMLAGRVFEAAQHFADFRLPELYCGFDRAEVGVPVPYPVACSPQAWSAAAPLLLVRTMLGLQASAADGRLELVRPHLPSFLAKLTITNLRVGEATVDLLLHRWRGTTSAEVLRKTGDLEVTIRV